MIEQERFSELIESFLSKEYPAFCPTIKYIPDGSFDCSLRSPSFHFSIWIATYNSEITFGLEDPEGNQDIHTHVSFYDEEDLSNSLEKLSSLIDEIAEGKTILIHSNIKGFDWVNDLDALLKKKKPYEIIKVYSWNSIPIDVF